MKTSLSCGIAYAYHAKDLQTLSECNRKVAVEFATEDPLEMWKQYGTIQNANVKARPTSVLVYVCNPATDSSAAEDRPPSTSCCACDSFST